MKYQLLATALIVIVAGKSYELTKGSTYESPNCMSPQEIIGSFETIGTDKYVNRYIPPIGDYEQSLSPHEIIKNFEAIGTTMKVNREVPPVGDYEKSFDGSKDKSGKYVSKDTPPTRDYESFQANKKAELASLINGIGRFMSNLNDQGVNFDILGLIKDEASAIK